MQHVHSKSSHSLPATQSFRWNLAWKIILSISGVLIVLAIAVSTLAFMQVRQVATANLERKGTILAETLNYTFEVLLGQEAYSSLQRVAENSALSEDVREIVIADRTGIIQVSSNRQNINSATTSPFLQNYLAEANWQSKSYITTNRQLIVIQPLRGGQAGVGSDGDVVGAVQITVDGQSAEAIAFSSALQLLGISLSGFIVLAILLIILLRIIVVRPIQRLVIDTDDFSAGNYSRRSSIRSHDEVGLLAAAFNRMATDVEALLEKLQTRISEAQEARATAELAQAHIAEQLATIEAQRLAIRDMSVPILPLNATTLVMPLVGALDTERLRIMQGQALQAVQQTRARTLIVDITGVPVIDTQVAQGLVQVVQAARLLGTEVVLVGIRPEVAQTVVGLGVDLNMIRTQTTLEGGIARALG